MNEHKKGKPYSFPDFFIHIIDYMRINIFICLIDKPRHS